MRDLRPLGAQNTWRPTPRLSAFKAPRSIPHFFSIARNQRHRFPIPKLSLIAAARLFTVFAASIVLEVLATDSPSILLALNVAEPREQNLNAVLPLGHFFVRSLLTTGLRPLPGVSRLAYRPQS